MIARADIVAALERGDLFPDGAADSPPPNVSGAGPVERRESHISDVFLTPAHAWKLLKPVRFDFLDFSTREARYVHCWNEVLLNRRLAPEIYLGVVPICDDGGRLRIGGPGRAIDWLIQMRRLPDEATLQSRIKAGTATAADIDRILDVLSPFFARAQTDASIAADGGPDAVHRNCAENLAVLSAHADGAETSLLPGRRVAQLRSMQLQFVATRAALFEARLGAGRVRELHGDLKPEHCYLLDQRDIEHGERLKAPESTGHPLPAIIIDCVAFNPRLRHIDTLDEVCFLAVELAHLGRDDLARHLLREYRERTGDDAPPELEAFFKSYRRTVRAKVACLSARGALAEERPRFRSEAERRVTEAIAELQPYHVHRLIAVFGMSGTGKSTVARGLAERIGAPHLASDVIRKELHGLAPHERGPLEIYSAAANARTYGELLGRAEHYLKENTSVIVDATFQRRADRERLLARARRAGVRPLFVECRCSPAAARERLQARNRLGTDASDADVAVYEVQARRYEPPVELPEDLLVPIDTERPPDEAIGQIVARIVSPHPVV